MKMKGNERFWKYPPMLFNFFSRVGYFPDGNNHIIEIKKAKKVNENAENKNT